MPLADKGGRQFQHDEVTQPRRRVIGKLKTGRDSRKGKLNPACRGHCRNIDSVIHQPVPVGNMAEAAAGNGKIEWHDIQSTKLRPFQQHPWQIAQTESVNPGLGAIIANQGRLSFCFPETVIAAGEVDALNDQRRLRAILHHCSVQGGSRQEQLRHRRPTLPNNLQIFAEIRRHERLQTNAGRVFQELGQEIERREHCSETMV